jgi:ABC-type branched-subunit amino acid transport system ATPase component/branched-subunit amino acid ABC-type transport system permease component
VDVFAQLTATGVVNGMIYALVAFGFIAVYRVTNVVNFAHGEFLMVGGFVFLALGRVGAPWPLAMAGAVAATALLGMIMHRTVIQPAGRGASVESLVIITIGASLLLRGAAQLIWGSDPIPVPPFTGGKPVAFLGISLAPQAFWVVAFGLVASVALWLFFTRTTLGLGLRACADNRSGADLVGIDGWRMGRTAFALGCGLAGLAGVLMAPLSFVSVTVGVMLGFKGFTVAILGGMRSFTAATAGGLTLGLLESYTAGYGASAYRDATTFLLLLLVLVIRPQGFTRGAKPSHVVIGGEAVKDSLAAAAGGLRRHWPGIVAAGAVVVVIPSLLETSSVSAFVFAGYFAVAAVGVILLLGYTGQISLGHATLMGAGGYASAILTIHIGWPPLAALAAGVVVACLVAWLMARLLFRFEGFYLAMVTLGLAVIFTVVISQPGDLTGGSNGLPGLPPFSIGGFDIIGTQDNFYLVWGVVLLCIALAFQLIDSRFGRSMRAIKGSEQAAVAAGVDPARVKRQVFVMAGGLAAVAGSLYVHYASIADPASFDLFRAINVLAMSVVGGMQTIWGALLGPVFMTVLPQTVQKIVSGPRAGQIVQVIFGIILMVVMVARPDGLAGAFKSIARGLLSVGRRVIRPRTVRPAGSAGPSGEPVVVPAPRVAGTAAEPAAAVQRWIRATAGERRNGSQPLLVVSAVGKTFGGLQALKPLSLAVPEGSITALVGPNGAGKTTAFNCVSGALRPDSGTVTLAGTRIDTVPAHQVVRHGLVRTFQNVQLFGNMSAVENVMVGCHSWTRAGAGHAMVRFARHRREESEIGEAARYWLDFVGLADTADRPAGTLPFGHQRLLELARAMAAKPRMLLLDEPAAGLNRVEKNRLGELIRHIQRLGVTVLLVEHDMTLVMELASTVVVLDHGSVIAEGTPAQVRQDKGVVEAYLGASA